MGYVNKHATRWETHPIAEVFTVPHVNPLDSTGFLWILRDSCGLQWTPNPIYLYGTPYNFWELDWTGVLSESTEIPVLLESCGLEPTELQGNPQDSRGLQRNPQDLTGLKGNPQDSRGLQRNPQDLTGLKGNPQDCRRLKGNPLDYLIIVKYIFISTCGDSNKVMYFVQLAGSGHVTIFT